MFPADTHFLVVDDSLNIRRLIVDTLGKLGFSNMTAAEDAEEALKKLRESFDSSKPITAILSDLNMPGPSGLDFLKQVRSTPSMEHLPFVLITTESEKGAVIEAARSGVSSYVVKPFNLETLTRRLNEAYKKHNPS